MVLFLSTAWTGEGFGPQRSFNNATFTFLALGSALVLVLTDRTGPRILGLAAVVALAFSTLNTVGLMGGAARDVRPTLVHVYLFTGFFIIYGAL